MTVTVIVAAAAAAAVLARDPVSAAEQDLYTATMVNMVNDTVDDSSRSMMGVASSNSDMMLAITVMMETRANMDMDMVSNEADKVGDLAASSATTPPAGQFQVFSNGRRGRPSYSTRSTSTSEIRNVPQHLR